MAFALLTFTEARELISKYSSNKTVLTVLFVGAGIVGVLLHHAYHLFYSFAFTRLQDRYRKNSDSYRTYLARKYGITQNQAMSLFRFLRDKHFKEIYSEKMETTGAVIHLLYLLFILSVVFIIINIYLKQIDNIAILSIMGIVGLLVGFLLDRKYEEQELHFIKDIAEDDLNDSVKKIFNIEAANQLIITPNKTNPADAKKRRG